MDEERIRTWIECAQCQGHAYRVRRRFLDHLVGLISRRYRYRCVAIRCGWEGTLRTAECAAPAESASASADRVAGRIRWREQEEPQRGSLPKT